MRAACRSMVPGLVSAPARGRDSIVQSSECVLNCCVQEYDQETKDYEVERHAVFWSDDGCKSLYKNHLKCALHVPVLLA
jgi:hypothetical protein